MEQALLFKGIKKLMLVVMALAIIVLADFILFINTPLALKEPLVYELRPGMSVRHLDRFLYAKGISKRPYYLSLWARLSGQSRQLKAGEYVIKAADTPRQLLDKMVRAKVQQYAITLVEGHNFRQMMQQIQASPYLEHQLKGLSYPKIMEKIGHRGEHPEGRFFPDTYKFPRYLSDVQFLKRAYQQMQQYLQQAWQSRDAGLPFKTPYEALILASIVEKETADPEERPLIAGVFINRLRKKMKLQTDPTVIYGLGESFDGDIRYRDLRRDTPYNTYTRRGLPPTPIAMPGKAAIDAVMHPAQTDYLYFVARSDGSGSHIFSATLSAHTAAVNQHQRKKR